MDSFTREGLTVLIKDIYRRVYRLLDQLDSLAPSSAGEEMESSPLEVRLYNLEHQIEDLYNRMGNLELRVTALEAGPQSRPTMAAPMRDSYSDAVPCVYPAPCDCPRCISLGREVPPISVPVPDSRPESTEAVTLSSSPSGQPTTPTFHVEPRCGCVPVDDPHQPNIHPHVIPTIVPFGFEIHCPFNCGALWAIVQIAAPAAPASPSESTST